MKINKIVLKLFGKALVENKTLSFESVNKESTLVGYVVHPDVCNASVLSWVKKQKRDYNSTFYKKWHDVISKSRFELLIDQLIHYASTYGTDFTGPAYVPDGTVDAPELNKMKVILPISKEEVITRCENMLFSGIALSSDTLEEIFSILDYFEHQVNIALVKNREAMMFLCDKYDTVPSSPVEMVRFLIYKATGKTLLIKDRVTLETIKNSHLDIFELVGKFGEKELSTVYNRFKPIFLSFKTSKLNRKSVNMLSKYSKKYHVPMTIGFFETLLSEKKDLNELKKRLKSVNNFKKVLLLQTINIRLKELNKRAFVIRNQKLFLKDGETVKVRGKKTYLKEVYTIIYSDLVDNLSAGACTVKVSKGVNLTLPTSAKSFIGNFPLGTSFDFSDSDNIVGIHWRGEDGANDLDLSLMSIDGKKYGWNSSYYNSDKSIVYSGDMTYASPEATELFYAKKGFSPSIVKVNRFSGAHNAKFRVFVAKEHVVNVTRNYMVNPNNIVADVECVMDSAEKSVGVISDTRFILAQFRTGRGRVSHNSVTDLYTDYALSTIDCYVPMDELLKDAGYKLVYEGDADIDLTNLSKDTLMSLMRPESRLVNTAEPAEAEAK